MFTWRCLQIVFPLSENLQNWSVALTLECSDHTPILYRVYLLSFVVQDRISRSHRVVNNKHLTTDTGSGQNKSVNTGLTADTFDSEQHCY